MSSEAKKYITFFNAVNANKKEGTFVSATVGGLISRFRVQDAKGKKLIRATMAVQNRAKAINYALGTSFSEDSDDPIWVDVNFWENRADRFEHMIEKLGGPNKVKVVLVGSLTARTYTKNDGAEGVAVTLTVSDWMFNGIPEKAQMDTPIEGETSQANASAGQTAPTAQQDGYSDTDPDFDEDGYFSGLDGDIDDLPF